LWPSLGISGVARHKSPKQKAKAKSPPAPPIPPPSWRDKYWKPFITPIEVAIAIGLWAAGLAVSDPVIAAILLGAGLVVSVAGIWAEPKLTRRKQGLMTLGVAVFFSISWAIVFVRQSPLLTTPVGRVEFARINEVRDFFGGVDENGLRQKFDIYTILDKNIAIQADRIRYRLAGAGSSFNRYNYTGDGTWIWYSKPGTWEMMPSGPHVHQGPKDIVYLLVTAKYQNAVNQINRWKNDPLLPDPIRESLSEFNDLLNRNRLVMFQVFNERLGENDNYFLKAGSNDDRFAHVITNDFVIRMAPLKPAADEIRRAITESLRVNRS
jgi:hypothetical protein